VVPVPHPWAGPLEVKWNEDGLPYPGDLFGLSVADAQQPGRKISHYGIRAFARTKKPDVFKAGEPQF
jgi:hypothetical protein